MIELKLCKLNDYDLFGSAKQKHNWIGVKLIQFRNGGTLYFIKILLHKTLSNISEMLLQHNCEMTLFPVSDGMHQNTCFPLLC